MKADKKELSMLCHGRSDFWIVSMPLGRQAPDGAFRPVPPFPLGRTQQPGEGGRGQAGMGRTESKDGLTPIRLCSYNRPDWIIVSTQ